MKKPLFLLILITACSASVNNSGNDQTNNSGSDQTTDGGNNDGTVTPPAPKPIIIVPDTGQAAPEGYTELADARSRLGDLQDHRLYQITVSHTGTLDINFMTDIYISSDSYKQATIQTYDGTDGGTTFNNEVVRQDISMYTYTVLDPTKIILTDTATGNRIMDGQSGYIVHIEIQRLGDWESTLLGGSGKWSVFNSTSTTYAFLKVEDDKLTLFSTGKIDDTTFTVDLDPSKGEVYTRKL